jgi:hypothetical protein
VNQPKPIPRSTGTSYERPYTDEQRDWLRFAEAYQKRNRILFMHKTDWLEAAREFFREREPASETGRAECYPPNKGLFNEAI